MDEQRMRAYVELIRALLVCPQGEEGKVLQVRAKLVDAGLLNVMEQYANLLEKQGQKNADWLRQFAKGLAKTMRVGNVCLASPESRDAEEFLVQIMQMIARTKANPVSMYKFFDVNASRLNETVLKMIPNLFSNFSKRNDPSMIAVSFGEFGNLIQQFPRGNRMLNLEIGIACYEQAFKVFTHDAFPEDWAITKINLANAYSNRIRGERADNLEEAIACYEQALQVYTQDLFPEAWALTQNNLANTYNQRIRGERTDSLERAIACYEEVLQVYTQDLFPEQWAMTQNNLAVAYSNRIQGACVDNLERAIACYEKALQVYTHDAFPEDWALTQNNLASVYNERIQGERAENLERAITFCEQALQVHTRDAFPEQWARIQNNLANAYSDRILGERADNLEQAVDIYEQALKVYTRDAFPEDWARTQNNLANIYNKRIRGERANNLEQAIAFYEQALQVHTRDAFPEQWARIQNNLALAYSDRIRGEQSENLERSIDIYGQALQVYTRDAFPEDWARTQNNLAAVYNHRIQGEQAENREQAIDIYGQALQVYTRDAFPEEWGATQHNLALAYFDRIRGERVDNLEQSINIYKQVLKVRTRDAFPEQWARTQNNLALAYATRIQGERADNIEQAVDIYEQALQVRTRDAFPNECRQTAQNLGNLYFKEENWEKAIEAYELATAANEDSYQESISHDGKGDTLKSAAKLARDLAYAYAKLENYQAASLTLEQSRARGLSESVNRDRANLTELQTVDSKLYDQYQDITQELRNREYQQRDRIATTDRNSIAPEASPDEAKRLRKKLKETIAQIRQVPGYENFLTPVKWKDIAIALSPNKPLIYIVTTSKGGMALIATDHSIEVLWLDDLTETNLLDLLNQIWFPAYNNSQTDRETWHNTIESTTRQLWDLLMGPIVQHLKSKGFDRATLIPTGFLSLLPLHAAWTEDPDRPTGKRYAIDDIHFTYTPNARSLTAAREIVQHVKADSILAIDNPRQDLPNSEREINCAIDSFSDRTVLKHDNATIDTVKAKLKDAAIVHFSCHGKAELSEPLNSGLEMSDGLLTLKDLLALNLVENNQGIRLAILSACETGIPGTDNIDEVMSLPIGLLQAGVAGVISSLWSVSDLSTMMLLTRFYDLWRKDGLEPSIALHQAQQWMHSTTDGEKFRYLGYVIPKEERNLRTYAHPFHWAAFSYLGI